MIKMELNDFIYEVTQELICYEEIGENGAKEWEDGFKDIVSREKIGKRIKKIGNKTYYMLEDESEIFDIADGFVEAKESANLERYWDSF